MFRLQQFVLVTLTNTRLNKTVNIIDVFVQDVNSQDVEFQLRLTFYDAANKCFFGSTWLGPYFPSSAKENGRHSVICDEVLWA